MNEKQHVKIADLFTDDFIKRHSNFNSLQEMVKASGIELGEILNPPFQIFCTYNTDFHSWEAMLNAAKAEYLQSRV
jgi:hypothetical protein